MDASDGPPSAAWLREQLGAAYERYSGEAELHAALLREVASEGAVRMHVAPAGEHRWRLVIAARDELGALSVIAGLLASRDIDILEADVFSLRLAAPPAPVPAVRRTPGHPPVRRPPLASAPRAFLLDSFEVRCTSVLPPDWDGLQADLVVLFALLGRGEVEAAQQRVIEDFSRHLAPAQGGEVPYPLTVELDNERDPAATVLAIRSVDTPGFLFEFTNALAVLRADVRHAEVRTLDSEVRDTFWVTDTGGSKISDRHRLDELRVAAALIKHFAHLLPRSPDPQQALRQFASFVRGLLTRAEGAADLAQLGSEAVLVNLADLMGVSIFLWEDFLRMQHANLFPVLAEAEALDERKPPARLAEELRAELAGAAGYEDAVRRLNAFKDREMFRIDMRHIGRRIGFLEFSRELADLADVVVVAAAALVERALRARHGVPRLDGGRECGWVVCALGKFGGRDLGFASDIELLFVYAGDGSTDGASSIANAAYFEALVRGFREAVHARRNGIFEVDLRLRPYGEAGALATSLEAFRRYYAPGGAAQQFERLSLVRLRPVAGDEALAARVVEARDAWVYSRAPLDLENIRHLRRRQATELVAPGVVNPKYSAGGIVDLEYFVQAKQIRHGAADTALRVPGTLEAAEQLARAGHFSEIDASKLQDAYLFLRRLIDALRVVRGNAKDLAIPERGSRAFDYLTRRLYFETPAALAEAIDVRMAFGRSLWERLDSA